MVLASSRSVPQHEGPALVGLALGRRAAAPDGALAAECEAEGLAQGLEERVALGRCGQDHHSHDGAGACVPQVCARSRDHCCCGCAEAGDVQCRWEAPHDGGASIAWHLACLSGGGVGLGSVSTCLYDLGYLRSFLLVIGAQGAPRADRERL